MRHQIIFFLFICSFLSCDGQNTFGTNYLTLEKSIKIPNVSGRIDHMIFNLKEEIVYVAALGNNTVEVVDLQKGTTIHSIKGLDVPQGIAYIAEHNEIIVANGGNHTAALAVYKINE